MPTFSNRGPTTHECTTEEENHSHVGDSPAFECDGNTIKTTRYPFRTISGSRSRYEWLVSRHYRGE